MVSGLTHQVTSHKQSRIGPLVRLLPLILVALSIGQVAGAQETSLLASNPFDQVNSALQHAADESLLYAGASGMSPSVAGSAPRRSAGLDEPGRNNRSDRVNVAELRLTALGVDARRIFAEENVPAELFVVADVESHFDPWASSPKGAVGLWQFMPGTARRYGLRVDPQADERVDPEKATRAAARYLRDLHLLFADWPLALAAYNAGETAVRSAMERSGATDFWSLSARRLLPQETRDYVARVLAPLDRRGANRPQVPTHSFGPSTRGVVLYAQSDGNRSMANTSEDVVMVAKP